MLGISKIGVNCSPQASNFHLISISAKPALLPKALDHIQTLESEVERLSKIAALYNRLNRKGAPKPWRDWRLLF